MVYIDEHIFGTPCTVPTNGILHPFGHGSTARGEEYISPFSRASCRAGPVRTSAAGLSLSLFSLFSLVLSAGGGPAVPTSREESKDVMEPHGAAACLPRSI